VKVPPAFGLLLGFVDVDGGADVGACEVWVGAVGGLDDRDGLGVEL
jgi:hypothetical protein